MQFNDKEFPVGKFDMFNQQIDLRQKNSWNMTADEVAHICVSYVVRLSLSLSLCVYVCVVCVSVCAVCEL